MMRFILTFTAIAAALTAIAQPKQWLDPTLVAQGKEPARSAIRSYNTADGALRQSSESLYLQPLAGSWTVSETGNETTHERDFKVPFEWVDRHVVLHMDAVQGAFEVFVNDRKVGYSQSTSTPAEFDIARYTNEGRNTLRIVVHRDHAGAQIENYTDKVSARLGTDNYVIAQPRVRVRDFVADTRLEDGSGLLSLGVIVKSQLLNNKDIKVYYDLLSPEGKSVSSAHRNAQFDMRGEDTVRFFANIPNIKTWSHEDPNLYTLLVKTQNEGRFTEYLNFKIGFRTIDMTDGKLLINGKSVELAVVQYNGNDSIELMRNDLVSMKARGVNCIKVKSHPLSRSFYDLCDELGLYVCDQAAVNSSRSGQSRRKGGNLSNDPRWENSYTDRAIRMYYNSKNHPSVVIFSIADNSANGYNLYQSYLAIKALEHSRPVIYLGSQGEWNSDSEQQISFDPTRAPDTQPFTAVSISEVDAKNGVFRVANNYIIRPLDATEVVYEVRVRKRVIANGRMAISVDAEGSTDVTIPLLKVKPGSELTFNLKVEQVDAPRNYKPAKLEPASQTEGNRLLQGLSALKELTKSNDTPVPKMRLLAEKEFKTVY